MDINDDAVSECVLEYRLPFCFLPSTERSNFIREVVAHFLIPILESYHVLPRNVCYHYRGIQPGAKCTFLGI